MPKTVTNVKNHSDEDGMFDDDDVQMLAKNVEEDEEELTLEDLAPDGGFGWIIAISMVLVFVVANGPSASFAIVYRELFEASGKSSSVMTLLNSVFMITFATSGLMTTALLKRYSMRNIGVVGALLFGITNVWSAFVTHVWHMVVASLIRGIGLGLMNNICSANFNAYWVKKRARVMSAAHVVIGLGGIVYPIMIDRCMSYYGFRGTAALMAGLSLNCIVGMMLMHPVEWHTRDPEEVRMERSRLAEESRILMSEIRLQEKPQTSKFVHPVLANRCSTIHTAQVFAKPSRWSSLRSLKEGGLREIPLLNETLRLRVASNPDVKTEERIRSGSMTRYHGIAKRLSELSMSSIGNIAGVGSTFAGAPPRIIDTNKIVKESKENGNETIERKKKNQGLLSTISDLFELSLCKDRVFMSMILGTSLVCVSDLTFVSLMPLMIADLGYGTREAALTITIGASTELISRVLFAIFTLFVNARPKMLFFVATICMAFAKIGFFYCDQTFTGILVTSAAIGVVRSWLYVPQPLVIVENFPVEKYAAAYGIFSIVSGVITIFFGPIIGIIKDMTNSFPICQLILIAMNSAFIVPWAFDFLTEKRQARRSKEMLKSSTNVNEKLESHSHSYPDARK